jgi:hypothetical protein
MSVGFLLCGLLLAAPMVQAISDCNYTPPPTPPTPEVTISKSACQFLIARAQFESADYKAGVDSEGRAVVPADLPNADQINLPETITIEIAPALAHWLPNQSTPYDSLNLSKINLGIISMTGGVLTFNGQPLSLSHQDELLALCEHKADQ